MRLSEFLTNDVIQIVGGLRTVQKYIRINGVAPFIIQRPEFMVMAVLSAHALTMRGLPTPREVHGDEFLSAKEIYDAIDEWSKSVNGSRWSADPSVVHKQIYKIRNKLKALGLNPNLIQTGQYGGGTGYRLSTLAENITLTMR